MNKITLHRDDLETILDKLWHMFENGVREQAIDSSKVDS